MAETGMSKTKFGRDAMNDGHFVDHLRGRRRGRVWPETAEKVRAFMRDHRAGAQKAAA